MAARLGARVSAWAGTRSGNAAAVLAGAVIFDLLRVPGGALIGAMAAATMLRLRDRLQVRPPPWARTVAFGILGWIVGLRMDLRAFAELGGPLRGLLLGVLVVVGGGLLLVWLLVRRAGVDFPTALLCAAPGGLAEMVGMADDAGARTEVVAAVHLVRLFAVILSVPVLAVLLRA